MGKDPAHRGKRRRRRASTIDEDLAALAGALAENKLDNNAFGWFELPWRDGSYAIHLAKTAALAVGLSDGTIGQEMIVRLLNSWSAVPNAYELAWQFYRELVYPKIDTDCARLLAAGLRCLHLKLANSHGGGLAYNEILLPAFQALEPKLVEDLVLEARCFDAIGTTHHLQGNNHDTQRHAFTIAWKRGLYRAAYAIRPIHIVNIR